MSHEKSLIHTSKEDRIPQDIQFERMHDIIADSRISTVDKIRLYKQEMETVVQIRKEQLNAARRVVSEQIASQVETATFVIRKERIQHMLELNLAFTQMLQQVGARVPLSQAKFLQDFLQEIMQFEEQLRATNLPTNFKQRIMDMLLKSWNNYATMFEKFADDILRTIQRTTNDNLDAIQEDSFEALVRANRTDQPSE